MSRYWETTKILSGEATGWVVPFFPEGRLMKLVVEQLSGTPAAFSVDVYNSNVVVSSGSSAELGTGGLQKYRVMPAVAAAAGEAAEFFDTVGYAFRNRSGPSISSTPREIYVLITPTASDTTWEVTLGGEGNQE